FRKESPLMFKTTIHRMPLLLATLAALLVLSPALPAAQAQSKGGQDLDEAARRAERERRQKSEQDERIRRLVSQFATYVQETTELVSRLETKASAYLPRMAALLTNDDGKRIAQDSTAFLHFVQLQDEPIVAI